jgi:hypothetical protein
MAGERRTRPKTSGGWKRGRGHLRLEVEGGPDDRAPLVSLWCLKENERRRELGRQGASWADPGLLARAGKRPSAWKPSRAKRKRREKGWAS